MFIQSFVVGSTDACISKQFEIIQIVDFGVPSESACNFLLAINSNFGLILPIVRDITGFLLKTATP